MEHYATRYKNRIRFLEAKIREYYMANYNAKELIGERVGVCGVATCVGTEERPFIRSVDGMKEIIKDLPLMDCGT